MESLDPYPLDVYFIPLILIWALIQTRRKNSTWVESRRYPGKAVSCRTLTVTRFTTHTTNLAVAALCRPFHNYNQPSSSFASDSVPTSIEGGRKICRRICALLPSNLRDFRAYLWYSKTRNTCSSNYLPTYSPPTHDRNHIHDAV